MNVRTGHSSEPFAPGMYGGNMPPPRDRTVSVVVPVYYNELSLPPLFEELTKIEDQLRTRNLELELIFVDDGSGDESLRALLAIKAQRESTKVIKLTRNFGAVHASKAGLWFVTGGCFAVLAADLQDPPELILRMVDRWLAGIKYVLCRRTDRDDPVTSKVFSYLYYWLIRMFVIPDFPKGGYDLALMDRSLLPHLQRSSKNINPAILAYWLGFKPDVLEYCRQRRTHGRSRWTLAKKAVYFIDSILGFSVLPIRLISALGFAASSISLGYGVLVVVSAALGHGKVQGFPTLVALVTFLLGLIIIMLGIIGEYLWRVFDEVNARPETVIDEIY